MKRASGGSGGENKRERSKWVINDGQDGEFDAVIVTVGTCGEPHMVQFPGMPGYKPKEEEHEDQHDEKDGGKDKDGEKQDANNKAKDKPQQDRAANGGAKPKKSAWSKLLEPKDPSAIKRNQQAKKAQGFPKPGEAYHGDDAKEAEPPTQDQPADADDNVVLPEKVGEVHGATTTIAGGEGPWEPVEEPTWKLGQDQVAKKEQGFPRPDEAYDVGPDVQEGTKRPEDVKKEKQGGQGQDDEDKKKDGDGQSGQHKGDGDGETFQGPILHSSQITSSGVDFKGKRVVVLGGGASAVESVETALAEGASHVVMVVRDDKVRIHHVLARSSETDHVHRPSGSSRATLSSTL